MPFPKILVLGATGRIGAVLRHCWPVDRACWQTRHIMAGAGWLRLDPLKEPEALARAADDCDTILCLAGVTHARAAAGGNPEDNLTLARAAIRAAAPRGARVLLASSAAVYGPAPGRLEESRALTPGSEYGRAKAAMEREGAELGARLGVAVSALRIGNIAGLDAILGGWQPGFALDRFADGRSPRRSYIGVRDLARVLAELCAAPDLPDVLNIAAPEPIEMGALLDAAKLGWVPRPAPRGAIPQVHLSVARLTRLCAPATSDPAAMVAQWQMLEPHMIQETRPA